jgi:hypothetical protein
MNNFKIGKWVRLVGEEGHKDSFGKLIDMFDGIWMDIDWKNTGTHTRETSRDSYFFRIKPWEPQSGEWCWFRSKHMPKYMQVLAQFKKMAHDGFSEKYLIVFNEKDVEEGVTSIYYDEVEPFIGELPNFIKGY